MIANTELQNRVTTFSNEELLTILKIQAPLAEEQERTKQKEKDLEGIIYAWDTKYKMVTDEYATRIQETMLKEGFIEDTEDEDE